MPNVKISDLPLVKNITGRELFVCAQDSKSSSIYLDHIRGRYVFPEDHGAGGNGTADDTAALSSAIQDSSSSGRPLVLAGGLYRIVDDIDFFVPTFFYGGQLIIEPGVSVTLTGRLTAPPERIFHGRIRGQLNALEVYPEWFGAKGSPYDAADPTDDTDALLAAIEATGGGVLRLNALYWTRANSLVLKTANAGLHLAGHSGASMKGPGGNNGQHFLLQPSGLALLEDGDWMLRFGSTEENERGCNQIMIHDLIFDGNHHKCHLGLIWAQSLSQAKIDCVAIRNVRGPGLFANKLEDVNITNSQMGKIGDARNKWRFFGAVVFGAPPKYANIGSNVVFFHACRFEWFDGGCFRAVNEPIEDTDYKFNNNAIPYVHHVILNQCKIEVGRINEDHEVYGDSRNLWAVFEFGAPINGARERGRRRWANNILVNGCHIIGVHHARTFARVGNVENFAVRGNNFTFSKSVQNPQSLFELMDENGNVVDCQTFIFKDNQTWVKGGADGFEFSFVDKSRYEITYEPPLTAKLKSPE